jgi:hypothetical protein
MSSNAPAQLLGYTVQFPRALLHLLKAGPGDAVSIEFIGDVATHKKDSTILSEEDKTSTVSNPLTDRSTDFWKTFYNWLTAIENGTIDLSKTRFFIYTNKAGKDAIINTFDKAASIDEAKTAIENAKSTLPDIDQEHAIWPYFSHFFSADQNTVAELVSKFELQIDDGLGLTEIAYELERLLIGKNQIKFVSNLLNGWLQEEIMQKIALKVPALILWEDYQKQFLVYFDRARKLELIDFALQNPPSNEVINDQLKIQPLYLQHLNHIKVDEDEMIEAVTDFLRAKVNRDRWIENEIIDEQVASDLEERLTRYWQTQQKTINLTERTLDEEDRGKILFYNCKVRQEAIRDMTPPVGTISGTYHALVEANSLGWHPRWNTF